MDALDSLITKAENEDLLQPLSTRALQHRVSFYADDVVLFLRPTSEDISLITDIIHVFGEASGLRNNVQKSSIFPIWCNDEEQSLVQQLLPCQVSDFPCRYLELSLSLRKLTRGQLQPYIDKIADQLPGRKILVQFMMAGMMIYRAMAVDIQAWGLKAVDKIRRGFYWQGRKDAKGGHCQVAWENGKLCRPMELGGLGISILKELGWALRMRWLWLAKTDPTQPWSALPMKIPYKAQAFFSVCMQTEIGDGTSIEW
jgi:hypothetical protein